MRSGWRSYFARAGVRWTTLAALLCLLQLAAWPQCGKERWSVKTGTDTDASLVNLASATSTTITSLTSVSAPHPLPPSSRLAPVETTIFHLSCTLAGFKLEADSDYHLVLKDDAGHTMIAEIPSPGCVGPESPFASLIAGARKTFDANYKASTALRAVNQPVQITGVGFFDFIHGQTGVAPNGIELHPVLSISFGQEAPPVSPQVEPSMASGPALTNADILALAGAGLGPEVILAKIRTSRPQFDTSPSALIELKRAGVPQEVITAMIYRQAGIVSPGAGGNITAPPGSMAPPGPPPSSSKGMTPAQGDSAATVYVTSSGKKYHSPGCSYLRGSSIPMKIGEAVAAGYTPCSRCSPPGPGPSTTSSTGVPALVSPGSTGGGSSSPQPTQAASPPGTPTGTTTATGLPIYEGPRGGHYHYSKSGKKVYERKK